MAEGCSPLKLQCLKDFLHLKNEQMVCCKPTERSECMYVHRYSSTGTYYKPHMQQVRDQNSQAVCSNSLPPLTKLSACVPSSAFSSITYGGRIDNLQTQLLWHFGPISLSPSQRLKMGWQAHVEGQYENRQTDQGMKCKHTWTALYSSKKNLWSACPPEIFYPTDSLQLGSWVGQNTLRARLIPMLLAANSH